MGAQGLAALGGVALSTALGRLGGPELLGRFTVVVTLLGALAIVARRGQGVLLTRASAWAASNEGRGAATCLLFFAIKRVVISSIIVGLAGSALLVSGLFGTPYPGAPIAMPLAVFLVAVLAILAGYARGTGRPWLAPLLEIGGVSLLTVVMAVCVTWIWGEPSARQVLELFVIALLVLAGAGLVSARRDFSPEVDATRYRHELVRGEIEFTVIAIGSFLIKSGSFVIAAAFLNDETIGLLRAAERFAVLITLPVLAINPVLVSRLVPAIRGRDMYRERRLVSGAMCAAACTAGPVFLVLLVWPETVLRVMGSDFGAATTYLRILASLHFLLAVLGPLPMQLNMAGGERQSMWIHVLSLLIAIILMPILCTLYGGSGFIMAYGAANLIRIGCIVFVLGRDRSRSANSDEAQA